MAERFGADLFPGVWGAGSDIVGLEPYSELLVTEKTSRSDIASFAFSDANPTLGFLSYEYGLKLKNIPVRKLSQFPLGHLKKYSTLLKYDRSSEFLEVHGGPKRTVTEIEETIFESENQTCTYPFPDDASCKLEQSLDGGRYIDRVKRVLDFIRDGYTYQINLTIEFSLEKPNLHTPTLFGYLHETYPTPYYAYFTTGPFDIISTSPERFLAVQDGAVLSQPIKGTLQFEQFDESMIRQLTESPKESAELSMIVDLIRNDISLNCEYNSVRVEGHKSTFLVDNLIQMYSNVHGTLRHDRTCIDLLLDAFPGGSVTGCPKKKSMEIIDELEPHSRDVYCGSFFVIRDEKNMESSIAIRTGYHDNKAGVFRFFAGSGIVIESDPQREYLETLAKTDKFRRVFGL